MLLALALLEGCFALWFPQEHGYLERYRDGYTFHRPFFDHVYSFNPEQRLRKKTPGLFASFQVPVRTNAWGQRDDATPSPEKPAGRVRILSLGDSFAFGWPFPFERSYLRKLRDLVPDAEWINCASMGAGAQQALLLFENECARFRPDLVIAQLKVHSSAAFPDTIGTDREGPHLRLIQTALQTLGEETFGRVRYDADGFPFLPPEALADLKPVFLRATEPKLPLYRSLNVVRFVEHAFFWKASLNSPRMGEWHARLAGRTSEDTLHRATENALLRLNGRAREAGARLAVVLVPGAYVFRDPPRARADWDRVLARLRSEKIPVWDLRGDFTRALRGGPAETLYLPGDSHPNEAGYDLITRRIAQELKAWRP